MQALVIAVGDKDGGNNDCFRGALRKIRGVYRARCIVQLALEPDISDYFPTILGTDTSPDFRNSIHLRM